MIRVVVELMAAAARLALEVMRMLLQLIAARPMLALGVAAVMLLAVLWSAVAYFWLLGLGVGLVAIGIRLRAQGL